MGSSKELNTIPLDESDEEMLKSWFDMANRSFPPKWMRGNSGLKVVNSIGDVVAVGWLIPTIVGLFGLGGVVLTRFGTTSYPQEPEPDQDGDAVIVAEVIESPESQALESGSFTDDMVDDIPDPSGED